MRSGAYFCRLCNLWDKKAGSIILETADIHPISKTNFKNRFSEGTYLFLPLVYTLVSPNCITTYFFGNTTYLFGRMMYLVHSFPDVIKFSREILFNEKICLTSQPSNLPCFEIVIVTWFSELPTWIVVVGGVGKTYHFWS